MKKNLLLIIIFYFSFIITTYAATPYGVSGTTNLKKGAAWIKKAKKLEAKGKMEKAKEKYTKALEYLYLANKEKMLDPDTLNYLGFASRKIGKLDDAEIYYLLGLEIDPNHIGINEYIGELYVNTNRINLAKERLEVLKNCICKEYDDLKELIESK